MIVLVYGSAFLGRSGYDAAGACAVVREGLARVEVGVAMATRLMDDDARYGDGMDGVFPDRAAQFMEGGGLYGGEGIDGLFPDRSAHFVDDPVGDPLGSVFSAGSAQPMGGAAPYGAKVDSVFPDRATQSMGGGRKATAWPFVWKYSDGAKGSQVFIPTFLFGVVGSLVVAFPGFALLTNLSEGVWREGSSLGGLATWILLVPTIVAAAAPAIAAVHVISAASVEYARDSWGRMWVSDWSRGLIAGGPGTAVSIAAAIVACLGGIGPLSSLGGLGDMYEALRKFEVGEDFERAVTNGYANRLAQRIVSVQSYAAGPFTTRVSCTVEPYGGGQPKRRRLFISRSCKGLDELMCEVDTLIQE